MSKHESKEKGASPAETGLAKTEKPGMLVPGGNIPKGMEMVQAEDLKLPQMLLVQSQSDICKRGVARAGDIVDTITEEVLNGVVNARKPVVFIPAIYFRRRVKWIDIDQGGGIDCDSVDSLTGSKYGKCSQCQHSKWGPRGTPNSKPACTLVHCFLGHVEGRESPLIMDLARTKSAVAQRLLSIMTFSKTPELWKKKWAFGIVEEANDAGIKYWNYDFQSSPGDPSASDQEFSNMLYNLYVSKVSQFQMELQKEDFHQQAASEQDQKDI